jgi:threonine synthase
MTQAASRPMPQMTAIDSAAPAARAVFRCASGCAGEHALDEVLYRCPSCAGLLEVVHDVDALRVLNGAAWRALFDRRLGTAPWPASGGVWGKKEWVHPGLLPADIVSLGEGVTPLVPAGGLGEEIGAGELYVKQCGISQTGSFKDLGMTVLVSSVNAMRRAGAPIRAVACASTGDTSAALASYCAMAGIPSIVILPKGKISGAQLVQPIACGALVLSLDTDFDGCMAIVQQLTEDGGIYLANSMNSLRIEGQKTVGIEAVQQLGWQVPDWIVLPGGNLGNVSALVAGLRMMRELGVTDRVPRVCVAQAARANPLYLASRRDWAFEAVVAEATAASAIRIGNPVSFEKAVRALKACGGTVRQASEQDLAEAAARADRWGLLADPHTGVALSALEQLVAEGEVRPDHRVVVVSTAHGLKFPMFKKGYHEATLEGVSPRHPNRPLELPAEIDAIRRALDEAL